MQKALFFDSLDDNKIQCRLCPHNCVINDSKRGLCRVRKNISGKLYAETYGQLCSVNLDPIEKKPLYHFYPGKNILSVGSIGCNLYCMFCQNSDISQVTPDAFPYLKQYTPEKIIGIANQSGNNIGIAYTYNEPAVWYEFMLDIAKQAKEKNLKNVMVTNGYINQEPLNELVNYIDAFNVDLKGFSDEFYKKCTSSQIEPVKDTIKTIKEKGKHLEITNLVIPTLNDDEVIFEEMVSWIARDIGKNTVLHISRYFPNYKMSIQSTSPSKLLRLYEIACKYLNYVYLGNIMADTGKNTYCDKCGKEVIKREGYSASLNGINDEGKCIYCENQILVNR